MEAINKDRLQNFLSLGADCEFGFLRKQCDLSRANLFNWVDIPVENLVAFLSNKLNGFPVIERTSLRLLEKAESEELFFEDKHYRFLTNTGIFLKNLDAEKNLDFFHKKVVLNFKFLTSSFIDDVCSGKFFVYKSVNSYEKESDAQVIFDALRTIGPAKLLVVYENPGHGGSVEQLSEDLIVGYLNWKMQPGGSANLDYASWASLIDASYDAFKK